jgi:hypothetical protein
MELSRSVRKRDAIQARHGDIGHDEGDIGVLAQDPQTLDAVAALINVVTQFLENRGDRLPHQGIVV